MITLLNIFVLLIGMYDVLKIYRLVGKDRI